jgi:hypothetical protein
MALAISFFVAIFYNIYKKDVFLGGQPGVN